MTKSNKGLPEAYIRNDKDQPACFRKIQSKLKIYADDIHVPIVSLWDIVVAIATSFHLISMKSLMSPQRHR